MSSTALVKSSPVIEGNYKLLDAKAVKTYAKVTKEIQDNENLYRFARAVLESPLTWIVGGTMALEYAEKKELMGNVITTSAEAFLLIASLVKASVPVLETQAVTNLTSGEALSPIMGALPSLLSLAPK